LWKLGAQYSKVRGRRSNKAEATAPAMGGVKSNCRNRDCSGDGGAPRPDWWEYGVGNRTWIAPIWKALVCQVACCEAAAAASWRGMAALASVDAGIRYGWDQWGCGSPARAQGVLAMLLDEVQPAGNPLGLVVSCTESNTNTARSGSTLVHRNEKKLCPDMS